MIAKNILRFLFFTLLPVIAMGQQPDPEAELKKLRAYYSGPEVIHISGNMILKKGADNSRLDKIDFEYWIKDKFISTRMDYIEVLKNKDVYVMVNNKRKTIFVRPAAQMNLMPAQAELDAGNLQSLLYLKSGKLRLLQTGKLNKLIIEEVKDPRFSNITITYDPADYTIRMIESVVKDPSGIESGTKFLQINYTVNEKTAYKETSVVFSNSKFGRSDKDGFVYATRYQNYQKL